MSIAQKVADNLKVSMLKKDVARTGALRGIKAAFVNELIAKKRSQTETLTDEEAVTVIRRLANQRKDSIEQFRKGGREELARAEEGELAVLKEFLPAELSERDIRTIAARKKAELGITDKSKIGQLIGAVMKEAKGQADGAVVKSVVEQLFE